MSNHFGNRLAAYVDGELPRVTRELISAHLLMCSTCRAAVEAEYRIKTGLTHLGAPDPSAHLMGALLDLAAPGEPMPPRRRPLGSEPVPPLAAVGKPVRIAFLGLTEPAIHYETRGSKVRRSLLAAGALGIAAVTLASAHAQNASNTPQPAGGGGTLAQVVGVQPNVEQVFGGVPAAEGAASYGHIHRR